VAAPHILGLSFLWCIHSDWTFLAATVNLLGVAARVIGTTEPEFIKLFETINVNDESEGGSHRDAEKKAEEEVEV